jgi:2-(1,2-epoxy-1,2-dihydrophenyl)acetyl-CoA isomerase
VVSFVPVSIIEGENMSRFIEIKQNGKIIEVVLCRPETYNAFNLEMITELAKHLTRLATDNSVSGIAITGKGKAFCAGGDLKWAVEFSKKTSSSFHTLVSQLHLAIVEIRRMKKPVVAAINGVAAGAGFSLALACDWRPCHIGFAQP